MKRVNNGVDADIEQFKEDLRTLADEFPDEAAIKAVSSTHDVPADDVETVELTLEIVGSEDSLFNGGYTIPFNND